MFEYLFDIVFDDMSYQISGYLLENEDASQSFAY